MINLKRVYEPPGESDGLRILVERLWPRGLSKERAGVDVWMKEIAPSAELRKWYNHIPDKWPEFQKRYVEELKNNEPLLLELKEKIEKQVVTFTFVFAATDEVRNSAVVLKKFLDE